jgi:hypothetical protein
MVEGHGSAAGLFLSLSSNSDLPRVKALLAFLANAEDKGCSEQIRPARFALQENNAATSGLRVGVPGLKSETWATHSTFFRAIFAEADTFGCLGFTSPSRPQLRRHR